MLYSMVMYPPYASKRGITGVDLRKKINWPPPPPPRIRKLKIEQYEPH